MMTPMMMPVEPLVSTADAPVDMDDMGGGDMDGGGDGEGGGVATIIGSEGGGGATIIGTATFSATVMVGACVTVTARATESAAEGCDVRAVAAASTVAARLAVGKFGVAPAGGLGTVISACTFTDADEIRSRSWHGS
jgi:hypothetical protein